MTPYSSLHLAEFALPSWSLKYDGPVRIRIRIVTGLGRGLREHGNKGIYFRGTRELRSENEGNRGAKTILGNRERRK